MEVLNKEAYLALDKLERRAYKLSAIKAGDIELYLQYVEFETEVANA